MNKQNKKVNWVCEIVSGITGNRITKDDIEAVDDVTAEKLLTKKWKKVRPHLTAHVIWEQSELAWNNKEHYINVMESVYYEAIVSENSIAGKR